MYPLGDTLVLASEWSATYYLIVLSYGMYVYVYTMAMQP